MGRLCLMVMMFVVLAPGSALGQGVRVFEASVDRWTLDHGGTGGEAHHRGYSFTWGTRGPSGSGGLSLGFVPEGETDPGWSTAMIKVGPHIYSGDALFLGLMGSVGSLNMKVDNRHQVMEDCGMETGCMFEERAFEGGWALAVGGGVAAGLEISPTWEITGEYGWTRLLTGANGGEVMGKAAVGLQYRFGRSRSR